jgi:hypothetical protein
VWRFLGKLNWTAISAIVSILALSFTILFYVHSINLERDSQRPYFIVTDPGIKLLSDDQPYRVQITLQNEGGRIVSNFSGQILFIDGLLSYPPSQIIELSIGNDIPPKSPTPWYGDGLILSNNMAMHYKYGYALHCSSS